MPSALDLIKTAAQKLGAIESGASLTAEEANDGLNVLNSMLDAWAIDRRYVYHIQQASHAWPGAATSRTIGSGGDFNTTRPERLEPGTFFRDSSSNDYPVFVTEDRTIYDRIVVKSSTSTYPQILFYDRVYPLGVLYVYPVPSSALTLKLNSWNILQSFATLTTDLSLPMGYRHLIEHNLAIELEPVFQLKAPDSVKRIANRSLAAMARFNSVPIISSMESASVIGGGSGYNIYVDG